MDKIYTRKLSVSERLWLGTNHIYRPFANQFIIEGHGNIDYTSLCYAVEVASAANPGSRMILKGLRSTGNLINTVYFEVTKNSTPESVAKDLRRKLDNKNYLVNIDRGINMNLVPIWTTSEMFLSKRTSKRYEE